jgi:hypothetical protein
MAVDDPVEGENRPACGRDFGSSAAISRSLKGSQIVHAIVRRHLGSDASWAPVRPGPTISFAHRLCGTPWRRKTRYK